ncbi:MULTISPECIES: recombinase family protein [Corynebacterium]|uniref:recombinase family protein n=1 Tax=Corynebacterium TaxID=1716 RepID=UPI0011D1328B
MAAPEFPRIHHQQALHHAKGRDHPRANLMLGILGSFAEFERRVLAEESKAALAREFGITRPTVYRALKTPRVVQPYR